MVRIHFAIGLADFAAVPFAKRRMVDLPDWAGHACNAEPAAKLACELFFHAANGTWERFIGATEKDAVVLIDIRRPKAIEGLYRVELKRTVKAIPHKIGHKLGSFIPPARSSARKTA